MQVADNRVLDYFTEFYVELKEGDPHPTQGEIFIPSKEKTDVIGIIIISNACDIEDYLKRRGPLRFIAYLPIYRPDTSMITKSMDNINRWIKIIQLRHPMYFFLPPYSTRINGIGAIVNFQNIFSMKIEEFLKNYQDQGFALNSPYRERLSMCVLKLFDRVPINHPSDDEIKAWMNDKL